MTLARRALATGASIALLPWPGALLCFGQEPAAQEAAVYRSAAELSFKKGDNVLAEKEARACLALAPNDERCSALLTLTRSQETSRAPAPAVSPAGKDAGKRAAAHWRAGVRHYEHKLYDSAKEEWAKCRKLDPSNADCERALQRMEEGLGDPPPAVWTLTGRPAPKRSALPVPSSEENKRAAVQHWNSGLIFFQQGQYEKSRDEWMLCKELDPWNSDCASGLQRIDAQFGGAPPAAPARQPAASGSGMRSGTSQSMSYHIGFASDSEALVGAGDQAVQQIADTLTYYPQVNLNLIGRADMKEADAEGLAHKRAAQVSSLLVNRYNIDSRRIQIQARVLPSSKPEVEVFIVSGSHP
ncbi:MAG: OmpA family protein [Proteobacteria bacterium]|nr:OmpA family protein [Pseudomonadota bacterium]